MALGKTHNRAALEPLEGALEDVHPAVRAAAAAGLGALGQRDALDSLRSRLAREPEATVRSQIETSIALLQASRPGAGKAKLLVKLGQLKNLTGVRGDKLTEVFRGATRAKAAELPGVEVLGEGSEGAREAESRKLPLIVLDGVVNRLAQGAGAVESALRGAPQVMRMAVH